MKGNKEINKSLLWDITRDCNLKCTHCYNSNNNSCTKAPLKIKTDYKRVIDNTKALGIDHIHLLGGEPLLAEGLFDLITYAENERLQITINTNGTLLTSIAINKFIISHVSQITISLDGATEEDNDSIRGSGAFNLTMTNIQNVINAIHFVNTNMIVQVATVITKQNIKHIHKLPHILKHLGVKHLSILKLYECGNASRNKTILYVDHEEYLKALKKLLIESLRNGIFIQVDCKPNVLEVLSHKYGIPVSPSSAFIGCCAAEKILFMDPSGDIYPCGPFAYSTDTDKNEVRVNIFDNNYVYRVTLFKNFIRQKAKANTLSSNICTSCKFIADCTGCALCYNDYDKLCETVRFFNC
jgi:radical SAM protein with 4Fe4S-binding SPASM domain